MIVGVLLAAGGARRFGSQKLVAPLQGVPLVRHAADALAEAADDLVVVVGNEAAHVRNVLHGCSARFVENAAWAEGLASSLRCGVAAVPAHARGVLVALGDQPGIDPAVARAVIARWHETGRPIVVTRYSDEWGHPTLFAREVFDELMALAGDRGARAVIERSAGRVAFVDVNAQMPRDVDTVDDLRALALRSGREERSE